MFLGSSTSPAEWQFELAEWASWRRSGWRTRTEPQAREQPASRFGAGRGLDPAHRTSAAGARIKVCSEHMPEQPRPSFSRSRLGMVDVELELELITRSRRRRGGTRISPRVWHDFFSQPRVARDDAKIPEQMPAWRGHRGTKPHHQVLGLEHHGVRAVLPRVLEPELEPSVGQASEPVLRDRWAGDVTTETLELSPVAPVDRLLGVDVDASVLAGRASGLGAESPLRAFSEPVFGEPAAFSARHEVT
jgi:hypothetical protein